jgi:hypothetical protein
MARGDGLFVAGRAWQEWPADFAQKVGPVPNAPQHVPVSHNAILARLGPRKQRAEVNAPWSVAHTYAVGCFPVLDLRRNRGLTCSGNTASPLLPLYQTPLVLYTPHPRSEPPVRAPEPQTSK